MFLGEANVYACYNNSKFDKFTKLLYNKDVKRNDNLIINAAVHIYKSETLGFDTQLKLWRPPYLTVS